VRDARYCCYVISESFWLTPRPGFSVQMTLMPAAWAADFLLMCCRVSSSFVSGVSLRVAGLFEDVRVISARV
jgi:hypothetical protein